MRHNKTQYVNVLEVYAELSIFSFHLAAKIRLYIPLSDHWLQITLKLMLSNVTFFDSTREW